MDVLHDYRRDGYRIVAIDNVGDSQIINEYLWTNKSVMVFGEEGRGLSDEVLEFADDIVYIQQYGSVRSLNVGTASGIVMYDYCSKVI
jgi:tRNA G18 (ribose-2'-O)-methylase SpoU